MVITTKRLQRSVLKLSIAAVAFASVGVAAATPFLTHSVVVARSEIGLLQPLATGPTIQLAKAMPGQSEDCVRVTRMVAPDGKEYPTNALVCGND